MGTHDDHDRGRDDGTCFCGCCREVRGLRLRATNALARRMGADVALFRGAAADGVTGADDAAVVALVEESGPLLGLLTARLHGDAGRRDVDKRAVADWLKRADRPRRALSEAALPDITGPLGSAVEVFYGGVRAAGQVVAVRDTGTTVNTDIRVEVTVEVRPAGGEPFEVSRKVLVPRIAFPRVGDPVEVGFDPSDPTRFAFRRADG